MRVKTQNVIVEESADEDELPLRKWKVEICLLDANDTEVPADLLSSVTYHLHQSFPNPIRKLTEPPFALEEEGWGEFDMKIVCKFISKGGTFTIYHDLNFQDDAFAVDYTVHVPLHLPNFTNELARYYPISKFINKERDNKERKIKLKTTSFGNWALTINEDTITKFTQLILNDPAIKSEINRHELHEKVYLYFGQFPDELLDQMNDFIRNPPNDVTDESKTNSDEEIDIFEDNIGLR